MEGSGSSFLVKSSRFNCLRRSIFEGTIGSRVAVKGWQKSKENPRLHFLVIIISVVYNQTSSFQLNIAENCSIKDTSKYSETNPVNKSVFSRKNVICRILPWVAPFTRNERTSFAKRVGRNSATLTIGLTPSRVHIVKKSPGHLICRKSV